MFGHLALLRLPSWVIVSVGVTHLAGFAVANPNCEDINGDQTLVAEMRYDTLSGSDTCYANSWWDGGDELALPMGGVLGGANSSATDLRFYAYGIHRDTTDSDGTYVVFAVQISYSNSADANGCPTSASYQTAALVVDSYAPGWGCTGQNYCLAQGGRLIGISGLSFKRFWKSYVAVGAGECSTNDTGCWELYDQSSCNLSNY